MLEEAEFIPAVVCSGSEDWPDTKERHDRKSIPQGRKKRRTQNGDGGVTTDARCDKCKGERRGLYLGAVIVSHRKQKHLPSFKNNDRSK